MCDSTGVDSTTYLLLDVNLWSLKPPFIHISVLFLINSMASGTVGTDLSPSLTYKFSLIKEAASTPNSFIPSSAAVLRAKLAQPGEEVEPKYVLSFYILLAPL